ncbi:MAG: hypothetical protein FJX45_15110 [Alphaproteobacteria bacterium]|nr:hypothetical protein [Alphaproteobacteria bacterium]MBM3653409.1 hypothetical protein [Alphaproteobacteria bacterium]
MKRNNQRFFTSALALALFCAAADLAVAQPPGYFGYQPARPGRARPSTYVGDCRPPYPPGYRHDLQGWSSGFTDRDFSCYRLQDD